METFGDFNIIGAIGKGGMADVALASKKHYPHILVAIKRINNAYLDNDSFIEMFKREGEIASSLDHRAIAKVHEVGTIDLQPYICMEYIAGKSLANVINSLRDDREKLSVGCKLWIIREVAFALSYIHENSNSRGIIHRDVSPHNIMVGFNGCTKLVDFGIAKRLGEARSTLAGVLKGKVAYMSPEHSSGQELDQRSDIFSLGIVLWELLCGKKLFVGASVEEIALKVQQGEVPPLVSFGACPSIS